MINKILNKQQSNEEIIKRDLNRIEIKIFNGNEIDLLTMYLEESNHAYYNLRDMSSSMGKFLYKQTKEQILLHSQNYKQFSVYESLCFADEFLVLQGDVFINDQFELIASLDDRKYISNREATKNPKYSLSLDLKELKEPNIKGLTEIINYITKHELFGCYVEFSIFDIPVGIHKENIIIWELRNY